MSNFIQSTSGYFNISIEDEKSKYRNISGEWKSTGFAVTYNKIFLVEQPIEMRPDGDDGVDVSQKNPYFVGTASRCNGIELGFSIVFNNGEISFKTDENKSKSFNKEIIDLCCKYFYELGMEQNIHKDSKKDIEMWDKYNYYRSYINCAKRNELVSEHNDLQKQIEEKLGKKEFQKFQKEIEDIGDNARLHDFKGNTVRK